MNTPQEHKGPSPEQRRKYLLLNGGILLIGGLAASAIFGNAEVLRDFDYAWVSVFLTASWIIGIVCLFRAVSIKVLRSDSTNEGHPLEAQALATDRARKRKRNYYAIASLLTAFLGFLTLLLNIRSQLLLVPAMLCDIFAIPLGILGMRQSKTSHRGRGLAIYGIVIGSLVCFCLSGKALNLTEKANYRNFTRRALEGQKVPHFTFNNQDGSSFTDATLAGSVYILDFAPYAAAISKADQFYQKHNAEGVKYFVLFPGFRGEDTIAFMRSNGFTVPVGTYSGGWEFEPFKFTDNSGHETVVVGRDGTILTVLFDTDYQIELEESVRAARETK